MGRNSEAVLDSGKALFRGGSGKWATERLMAALKAGRPLTTNELRDCSTLRKDEWKEIDTAVLEEGAIRLQGVADLLAMPGMTRKLKNGFGTTIFEWETMTDMDDAIVSMDGITRSENQALDFALNGLPMPFTHKDFNLNLRVLEASRKRGEPLDTTEARLSSRKVAEKTEDMLFNGGKTFGGMGIYGYTTYPYRNTASFGTGGAWSGSKTGAQVFTDVQTMIAALEGDRMYGPFGIYVTPTMDLFLNTDYSTEYPKTIRARILENPRIKFIKFSDKVPANTVVMVQLTPDVVQMVQGEPLQTIQWDVEGGMQINYKVFQILVPLIRSDAQNRCGIVVMS